MGLDSDLCESRQLQLCLESAFVSLLPISGGFVKEYVCHKIANENIDNLMGVTEKERYEGNDAQHYKCVAECFHFFADLRSEGR